MEKVVVGEYQCKLMRVRGRRKEERRGDDEG